MAVTSDGDCTTPKETQLKHKEEKSDPTKDVPHPSVLKENGTNKVLKILTDNKYCEEDGFEPSIDDIKPGVTESDNSNPEKPDDDLQVSLPNEKEATITTQPQQCDNSPTGKQHVSDFVDEDQQGWSKADLEAYCEKSDRNGPAENCPPPTHLPGSCDPRVVAKLLFAQYPEPFVQKVILHLMEDDSLEEDLENSSKDKKKEDLQAGDPDKDDEEEPEMTDTLADKNSACSEPADVEQNKVVTIDDVVEKDTEEVPEKVMKKTRAKADGKKHQKTTNKSSKGTKDDKKSTHGDRRAFKRSKTHVRNQKTRRQRRAHAVVDRRTHNRRKPAKYKKYKSNRGRRRGRRGGGRQAARRAPGDKSNQQSGSGSQTQTRSSSGSQSAPLPLHRTTSQSSASGDDGGGDPPRRPPSASLARKPSCDGQVKREERKEEEPTAPEEAGAESASIPALREDEDIVTTLTALLAQGMVFPEQDQVQQFIQALVSSFYHRQYRGTANWASCNCSSCKVVLGAVKHVTTCSKLPAGCEICAAVFYCAVSHSMSCAGPHHCPVVFCRDIKIKLHTVEPGPARGIVEKLWSFLRQTIKRSAPRAYRQPDLQYGASGDGPVSLPVFPGHQLQQDFTSLQYSPGTQPPLSLPVSAMLGARPKRSDRIPTSHPPVVQQPNISFQQAEPISMPSSWPDVNRDSASLPQPLQPPGSPSGQADVKKTERKLPACLKPRGGKKDDTPPPVPPPRRQKMKSTPEPPQQSAQLPPEEVLNMGPMEGFCQDDFRLPNPVGRHDVKLRPMDTPRHGAAEPNDIAQSNHAVVHAYFTDRYGETVFNDKDLPCLPKGSGTEDMGGQLVAPRPDYLQQRSVQSLVSSSIQVTSSVRGLLPSYNNTLYNYSQVVAPPPDGLESQGAAAPLPNMADRLSQLVTSIPTLPADAISSLLSLVQRPVLPQLGMVSAVSPRHMSIFAAHWEQLAEELLTTNRRVTNEEHEGFILDLHAEKLPPCDGKFRQGQQWWSIMELGSGRFGTVYLGCLASENQEFNFAAKKMDVTQVRRDELEICCHLDNPYIAAHYGAVREGRDVYIFMEFLEGYTLEKIIDQYRTLHQYMALFYLCQVFEGLVYLEEQRIVHSDIKAANMMVSSDGAHLKIIDFGMAHCIPDGAEWVEPQRNAFPEGTQTHMPTEVAKCKPHNCRVDVWSGCCVGLHMLNGCHPWIRRYSHAATLLLIIVDRAHEIQTEIPSTVHESFQSLLRRGLDPDPATRPSAANMLTLADEALAEVYNAVGSGPPSPTEPVADDTPLYSPQLAPQSSGGGYGITTSELRRIVSGLDQDERERSEDLQGEVWDSTEDKILTSGEQGSLGSRLLRRGGGNSPGEDNHRGEQRYGNDEEQDMSTHGCQETDISMEPPSSQVTSVEGFTPVLSMEDCGDTPAHSAVSAQTHCPDEQQRITPEGRADLKEQEQCHTVGHCPMEDKAADTTQLQEIAKVLPAEGVHNKEGHKTVDPALTVNPSHDCQPQQQLSPTEMVASPQDTQVPLSPQPSCAETKIHNAPDLCLSQNIPPPSQLQLVPGAGLWLSREESMEDIYLGEADKHKMPQMMQGHTEDGDAVTITSETGPAAHQLGPQSLPAMVRNTSPPLPPPNQPASLLTYGSRSRVRLACAFSHPLHTQHEKEDVVSTSGIKQAEEINTPSPETPPSSPPVSEVEGSSPGTEGSSPGTFTTEERQRKGSFLDQESPSDAPLDRRSSAGSGKRSLARETSRMSGQSVEEVEEQLLSEFLLGRMMEVDDLDEQEELMERASQLSASSFLGGMDQAEERVLEYGTSSGVESGTPSPSDPQHILRTISASSGDSTGTSGVLVKFMAGGITHCQCRVKPAKTIVELCEGVAKTIQSRGFNRFTIVHTDGTAINADATLREQGSKVVGQELAVEVVTAAGDTWEWCINEQCILEYKGEGERMFPID